MLQNATPLRADFLTFLMEMSLALHLPRKVHVYRSSSNVPRLPSSWKLLQCLLTLHQVQISSCHTKRRAHVQKWSEDVFVPLCATTACTSKNAPNPLCFSHFDFDMCFAPQRHSFLEHGTFQRPKSAPSMRCF